MAATTRPLRRACRFVLLTGVRKGEFIGATWHEIDFDTETWTIPSRRMKGGGAYVVYLSDQAMDILTTRRSSFSASRYLHSGCYDSDLPISDATLNRVIAMAIRGIQTTAPEFVPVTVHDLRRTFSTSLNRAKFDERWIEMALAHVPRPAADSHARHAERPGPAVVATGRCRGPPHRQPAVPGSHGKRSVGPSAPVVGSMRGRTGPPGLRRGASNRSSSRVPADRTLGPQ